jgi:hypothetical protein
MSVLYIVYCIIMYSLYNNNDVACIITIIEGTRSGITEDGEVSVEGIINDRQLDNDIHRQATYVSVAS